MVNETKILFLENLKKRYGNVRKLKRSQSLYEICDGAARIYVRYSKLHNGNKPFYGLRGQDLKRLEGSNALICFLWEGQKSPLFIHLSDYEEIFQSVSTAADGQYKVSIFMNEDEIELYIAKAGRFNVNGNFGWNELDTLTEFENRHEPLEISHSQIQTIIGSIGDIKGFNVWIPPSDRSNLDWSMTDQFECSKNIPYGFDSVKSILQEIDVIWIKKGSNILQALFEVEHTTPIYSGLLRFNDIHLLSPQINPRFSIVADYSRRSTFTKHVNRPTFKSSGLSEICSFMDYYNVLKWYDQLK